jgi:PhnB protein
VAFYRRAFGAELLYGSELPGGRIVHAHVKIADSVVMMTEESLQEMDKPPNAVCTASPRTLGASTAMLEIYVGNVDEWFRRATAAGAKTIVEPQEMFYGDRYGILQDPLGHLWAIATVLEELTPEEVNRRAMQMFAPAK